MKRASLTERKIWPLRMLFRLYHPFEGHRTAKKEPVISTRHFKDPEQHAKMVIRANLELAKTEERLSKKVKGLSILHDIGETIGKTNQIGQLLTTVAESLITKLDYDRSMILCLQKGLSVEVQVGFSAEEIQRIRREGEIFLERATENDHPNLFLAGDEGASQVERIFGCTSLITVPLRQGRLLVAGKNVVYDSLTEDDLEIMAILATQTQVAMDQLILHEALRQERDQLRQAKEALEQWSQTLEQRVEERTQKLQEAQSQLIQASKLTAVGQLAAGIAHELNNPIGGILGYAQLALERLEQIKDFNLKEVLCRYMQTVEKETLRCKGIIESLLRFSRSGIREKPNFKWVRIEEVLRNTLTLTQHQLERHQIKITQEFEPNLPLVRGDNNQLQQVVMNIILNADQAMSKGGQLRIKAQRDPKRPNFLQISFQDDGCGIPPEFLDKIFDPFFTTREPGQGTGLGLSISYGIIQDHLGEITVESQVNQGTIFNVYLPLEFTNDATTSNGIIKSGARENKSVSR